MEAVPASARMTAEEFLALPEDWMGRRWQLVDGELVMNEPTWTHGHAQKTIIFALESWIRGGSGRGAVGVPVDVRLDERNVYGPDVVWYREGRAPSSRDKPPYPMPDLVVEVRSPSSWHRDSTIKKRSYEQHGAGESWLVDTKANVVIAFRRSRPDVRTFDVRVEWGPDEILTSPLLQGFELVVGEVLDVD